MTVSVSTAFESMTSGAFVSAGFVTTRMMSKLLIITRRISQCRERKCLRSTRVKYSEEEFLKPLGLTQYRVAKGLGVPARRINEVIHAKRAITADTALRLGRFFRNSPRFWLNLQKIPMILKLKRFDLAPLSLKTLKSCGARGEFIRHASDVSNRDDPTASDMRFES